MTPAETGATSKEKDYFVNIRHDDIVTPVSLLPVSSVGGRVEEAEGVTSDVEPLEEVVDVTIGKTVERGRNRHY